MFNVLKKKIEERLIEDVLQRVRAEYTVMPRFGFHQPLDYHEVTLPPHFQTPETNDNFGLPVPVGKDRFGYSEDNTEKYLEWGKYDHDELVGVLEKYHKIVEGMNILDFGCSSGRVLRHFEKERIANDWSLYGCDIQALAIQWMRQYFPSDFKVLNTSTLPHLPFPDNHFDFIYGFSVFTHIKYQWDAWLMELNRVMKPNAVMVQSIHTENAWKFYFDHHSEEWVRNNHTSRVYDSPSMDVDFLYHGDACVSQVFWKKEIAKQYWGRYFEVLELRDPPQFSFQDWVVCKKI